MKLKPCPFCGETPDPEGPHTFQESDGGKLGGGMSYAAVMARMSARDTGRLNIGSRQRRMHGTNVPGLQLASGCWILTGAKSCCFCFAERIA